MPASRRTKLIIWSMVGVLGIGVAWFAHGFYRAWHRFASEERICGAFHPVIAAIEQFQETTGSPPTNLTQLVPRFVPRLPVAPVADSIDYRLLPDGTNWQLSVRSRVTGDPRVFVQRSSRQFTADEERQAVAVFHGWRGFKNP
jgi:hypothetical protein